MAKGTCLVTLLVRVSETETEGFANCLDFPEPWLALPKRPPVLHQLPPPLTAPQTRLHLPEPQTSCLRLNRLQPEKGHLTLFAGVLIPSRWAGGLHRGPSCPIKAEPGPTDRVQTLQ